MQEPVSKSAGTSLQIKSVIEAKVLFTFVTVYDLGEKRLSEEGHHPRLDQS